MSYFTRHGLHLHRSLDRIKGEQELRDVQFGSQIFRHLLRALLREASYLPDPAARSYIRNDILDEFRSQRKRKRIFIYSPRALYAADYDELHQVRHKEHHSTQRPTTPWQADQYILIPKSQDPGRQFLLLQRGRKELQVLARANLGHETALKEVLDRTYGRRGRRRLKLVQPLLEPKVIENTEGLRQQLSSTDKVVDFDPPGLVTSTLLESPKLVPKLEALITAQAQTSLPTWPKVSPKCSEGQPSIWNRPLPLNRRRNIVREWAMSIQDRALPPLPPDEFERLREIAIGQKLHGIGPVRRRAMKMAENEEEDQQCMDIDQIDVLTSPLLKTDTSHRLTTRYLARCIQSIYEMTPTLEKVDGAWVARFYKVEGEWQTKYHVKVLAKTRKSRRRPRKEVGTKPAMDVGDSLHGNNWMFSSGTIDNSPVTSRAT